ncbi:MAG TPA: TRL-like family protein [Candidatus Binataceae bacterium]|nr:TRL-like family protein [Candidatus Binataceae bacterium]
MSLNSGIVREWNCLKLAAAALAIVTFAGCMPVSGNALGYLYADTKGPVTATSAKETSASKTGTACEQTVLALFAWGDASIDTAKKSAGITEIISVDQTANNILGIYATYCVVVKGN